MNNHIKNKSYNNEISKNIDDNYSSTFKQNETEETLTFKTKTINIYDSLKKMQNYFDNSLNLFEVYQNSFTNNIKKFYEEISIILKKIIFNYESFFKINENNNYENNSLVDNLIYDNSIFNEFNFTSENYFEDLKKIFILNYMNLSSEVTKEKSKTLIIYHNKFFKHCDFSNLDQITRINKRSLHMVKLAMALLPGPNKERTPVRMRCGTAPLHPQRPP